MNSGAAVLALQSSRPNARWAPQVRSLMVPGLALGAAIAFPLAAQVLGHGFYIGFATRVMIFVLAVSSLNLLVGYTGLVSFGHAAYFGFGAYAIGFISVHAGKLLPAWAGSAWFAWPFAMACSALLALVIGSIALRTRQVYFIMITLAFSQMVYFLFVGMHTFGSDNGMSLPERSALWPLNIKDDTTFYFVVLTLLVASLCAIRSIVRSRFGHVVQGIKENESRMAAIGFPVYRYKLICFVMAGALAGLAGALLANQNSFVSPRMLDWVQSGNLLVMLILGGVGHVCGGIYGTVLMLVLEEVLSSHTEYWQFFVGIGVIVVVMLGRGGLAGLADWWRARRRV